MESDNRVKLFAHRHVGGHRNKNYCSEYRKCGPASWEKIIAEKMFLRRIYTGSRTIRVTHQNSLPLPKTYDFLKSPSYSFLITGMRNTPIQSEIPDRVQSRRVIIVRKSSCNVTSSDSDFYVPEPNWRLPMATITYISSMYVRRKYSKHLAAIKERRGLSRFIPRITAFWLRVVLTAKYEYGI